MSADKQTPNRSQQKSPSTFQRLSGRFMSGLLRSLFFINRPTHSSKAGFVLPTTVLLLLVMTLTVGALSFRTASRTQSTYLAREQQVIDNIAAPAVDRAKAKLEYLFVRDVRMPGAGTPSSDVLALLLLNKSGLGISELGTDPYTLPDETRLDINGDDKLDNAWSFSLRSDGSATPRTIAYSLLTDDAVDPAEAVGATPGDTVTVSRDNDIKLEDTSDAETQLKANNLVVRNGPINTDQSLAACGGSREPEQGWLPISSAVLEKNFQITAFVSNEKKVGRANSALELQQVRRAAKGNRWGAWFRYDLELHPGAEFNWNGAMHSEGSMFLTNEFKAHMISSHNSCLYSEEASEITVAEVDKNKDDFIDVASGDFQGQMVAANPAYGSYKNAKARIHVFDGLSTKPKIDGNDDTKLKKDTDSLKGDTYNDILKVQMDPVALFTENVSKHRDTSWQEASNWKDQPIAQGRAKRESQEAPYLDDFYRADERYGPIPDYGEINWVQETSKQLGDEILEGDLNADALLNDTSGLDGYWERQAIAKGLRVVIGQRLELGDHLGWNFDAVTGGVGSDPLYPPDNVPNNKQKQRVTLRDNLAAVQGMVVYHYQSDGGQYPLACIASTAHPGTLETLINSRNFEKETFKDSSGGDITVISNFLKGKGTNGWEYDFPSAFRATKASPVAEAFGAALAVNRPLGIALRNLANFAGDPKGGSPSFTPTQDANVHPYPHMAMWGDYSILRRIFDERLDKSSWNNSTTAMADRYDKLSPADKSYLHSAACTMGLLSQSINSLNRIDFDNSLSGSFGSSISNQGDVKKEIGTPVWDLMGATNKGPSTDSLAEKYCTLVSSSGGGGNPSNTYNCDSPTKEEIIAAAGSTLNIEARSFIDNLSDFTQVERDRIYGFEKSPTSATFGIFPVSIGNDTYNMQFPDECHPDNSAGVVFSLFNGGGGGLANEKAGVSLVCATKPKYPALHYLFPKSNHDQDDNQPLDEKYLNDDGIPGTPATNYIFNENDPIGSTDNTGVNASVIYKVVGDDNADGDEDATELGTKAIAFDYHPALANWKLPNIDTGTASNGVLNPETMEVIDPDGDLAEVSLLDKVMFNARESMAVRVLDIDIAKLTQTKNGSGDYWIPDDQDTTSGIFYAVREDALREDSITRPRSVVSSTTTEWQNCNTLVNLIGNKNNAIGRRCWMRATGSTPTDPPLSRRTDGTFVGISVKPIDFAPDPDRRPYGFRLNAHLNGNKGDLSNNKTRDWGFTFITDNAAYIRGEFNPHTATGAASDTLEEFEETLYNGTVKFGTEFYTKRKTYNTDEFATNAFDRWRVTEILADAVSLLSDNFVDGAIQEGFIRDREEVSTDFKNKVNADSSTSFHNQQRPLDSNHKAWGNASQWLRIDGSKNDALPIWVGRNGESRLFDGSEVFTDATANREFELPQNQDGGSAGIIDASVPERMNATIITGLVPSRNRQTYGGLHNFPRFLEDWNDGNLFIQGAFLQLNFSTASTGPFDADAWEPGEAPVDEERYLYYKPPNRQWGYDVGLQYATAGPIAQRFVTLERPRSEHYRELSIEDPYITNLRCARTGDEADSNSFVKLFSDESCPSP